jgi:ABC-2 type transport system ATP-binding protein
MSTISVNNLSKFYKSYKKEPGFTGSLKSLFNRKYEQVKAVDSISFQIGEGEIVGFIGPNGAGKTTTLKCLSGLLYPTEGKVEVLGFTPFKRKTAFLKQISLVMGQKNQLWWDLPGMDTLLLNKEIYEISDNKFKEVVEDLTKILEASEFLHVPVRKLSLGQRMKMELMAALIHSPKVLFLDVPTIGLDVVMQKNLRDFIKAYNRKYNATVILTSHYMGDVEELCKRIIIINHGKILYDGLLEDLAKKHAPNKIVTIVLKSAINTKKLEGLGIVRKYQYPEVIFEVSSENSGDSVARILKELPVEDVNIEDPDIEDIIRDIFSSANEKS